jgi:hypothetical protein
LQTRKQEAEKKIQEHHELQLKKSRDLLKSPPPPAFISGEKEANIISTESEIRKARRKEERRQEKEKAKQPLVIRTRENEGVWRTIETIRNLVSDYIRQHRPLPPGTARELNTLLNYLSDDFSEAPYNRDLSREMDNLRDFLFDNNLINEGIHQVFTDLVERKMRNR